MMDREEAERILETWNREHYKARSRMRPITTLDPETAGLLLQAERALNPWLDERTSARAPTTLTHYRTIPVKPPLRVGS